MRTKTIVLIAALIAVLAFGWAAARASDDRQFVYHWHTSSNRVVVQPVGHFRKGVWHLFKVVRRWDRADHFRIRVGSCAAHPHAHCVHISSYYASADVRLSRTRVRWDSERPASVRLNTFWLHNPMWPYTSSIATCQGLARAIGFTSTERHGCVHPVQIHSFPTRWELRRTATAYRGN